MLSPSSRLHSTPVHQTPFQRRVWLVARDAHASGDRADGRILLNMIEDIDEGNYAGLLMQVQALRPAYRDRVQPIPEDRADDLGSEGGFGA